MKIKHAIFIIGLYLLIFQDFLQIKIGALSYLDELFSYGAIFLAIIFILMNRKKLSRHVVRLVILMVIILICGIIGNVIYNYQSISNAFKDIIIVFKSILIYISTIIVLRDFDIFKYDKQISFHLNLTTAVIFTLSIINLFVPIFPYYDFRWGINTQTLFFSHPTYLASTCSAMICILIGLAKGNKYNYISVLALTVVIVFSGRIKAIVFITIYLFIAYIILNDKNIKVSNLIFISIPAVMVSYERVLNQIILNDKYPRAILNRYGLIIANEHFPIGSGFGTFASYISGQFYSNIYSKYGIDTIYGLTRDYHPTISDSFWPMIVGQFGYIGLVSMGLIVFDIFIQLFKSRTNNKYYFLGGIGLILYLLISSTSESSFVNYYSVSYFVAIGLFTNALLKKGD